MNTRPDEISGVYLTQSVFKVVLGESIPSEKNQHTLNISDNNC